MKTSCITLSFSSWSMLCTNSTSSLALILVVDFFTSEGGWVWELLEAALMVVLSSSPVAHALDSLGLLGQFLLRCPCHVHWKHLPSFCSLACSSLVRAAYAQVCPPKVSMALGSLAKPFCHCCLVGHFPCLLFWNKFQRPCLRIQIFCC